MQAAASALMIARDPSVLLTIGRPLAAKANRVVDAYDEKERESKEQCEQHN